MRAVPLLLIPIAVALSGCAQFIIFGHPVGGPHPTVAAESAASAVGSSDATESPATAAPAKSNSAASIPAASAAPTTVTSVIINFTPAALDAASAAFKLQWRPLRTAIEGELRARKLLGAGNTTVPGRTIEISIDGFTARTASNVVMFGQLFEAGTLTGDVTVRDRSGAALQTYRIKANSHLNRPATGATVETLTPLYRKFADLTVDDLDGAPRKPVDLTNTGMPR
ncbi:MAG TPA: hypothetical protein VGM84_01855 [Steroidobacteraceae bacterium]|jgi:hypothetical protein